MARERGAKRSGADESNEIRVNEKLEELTKRMRDANAGCEEIRSRGKEREGYTVKGYISGQSQSIN